MLPRPLCELRLEWTRQTKRPGQPDLPYDLRQCQYIRGQWRGGYLLAFDRDNGVTPPKGFAGLLSFIGRDFRSHVHFVFAFLGSLEPGGTTIAVKAALPHAEFMERVKREADLSYCTVQRYMRLAKEADRQERSPA